MRSFDDSILNDFMVDAPRDRTNRALEGAGKMDREGGRRRCDELLPFSKTDDMFGFGGMFNAVHRHMNDTMKSMMSFSHEMVCLILH